MFLNCSVFSSKSEPHVLIKWFLYIKKTCIPTQSRNSLSVGFFTFRSSVFLGLQSPIFHFQFLFVRALGGQLFNLAPYDEMPYVKGAFGCVQSNYFLCGLGRIGVHTSLVAAKRDGHGKAICGGNCVCKAAVLHRGVPSGFRSSYANLAEEPG